MKEVTPALIATIKDGSINLEDKELFKKLINHLDGKRVKIKFMQFRANRSNEQNSYYWSVIIKMIAEHCGYFSNDEYWDIHVEMKRMFLPKSGKLNIASSSNLTTIDFEEYQSKIRMWASQYHGLTIPKPNEDLNKLIGVEQCQKK